jgi:hypothetical protein
LKLPDQWNESIIVPFHIKVDKTHCNNHHGISLLSTSYRVLSNTHLSKLNLHIDEITGDRQCGGFGVADQLLIRFSAFVRYWRKNIEFGVPMKLVRLIKMC